MELGPSTAAAYAGASSQLCTASHAKRSATVVRAPAPPPRPKRVCRIHSHTCVFVVSGWSIEHLLVPGDIEMSKLDPCVSQQTFDRETEFITIICIFLVGIAGSTISALGSQKLQDAEQS